MVGGWDVVVWRILEVRPSGLEYRPSDLGSRISASDETLNQACSTRVNRSATRDPRLYMRDGSTCETLGSTCETLGGQSRSREIARDRPRSPEIARDSSGTGARPSTATASETHMTGSTIRCALRRSTWDTNPSCTITRSHATGGRKLHFGSHRRFHPVHRSHHHV